MFIRRLTTLRPAAPLFLHPAGPNIKLSFSKNPAATAMGEFPEKYQAEFTKAFNTEPDLYEPQRLISNPSAFVENNRFWETAQKALKENIHLCPIFSGLATAEDKSRFFHIYDLRNPPPPGRIPEVEDILGTVQIEDGKIIPNSFEGNAMYRPVSSFGAIMLSKEMAKKVANAIDADA